MPFRRYLPHYLMIAPFMVLFAVFFLYPILSGLYYSFHDWNGVKAPEFVGAANYTKILASRDFSRAMGNLAAYIAITVPLGILVALGLALLVDSFTGRWSNFFRNA
ncbi:MAG: carbohydrate transporter rane protein 1, family, partial [Devosia sp.]|nr:carbohydrate transporter rane protein 1, family [Devosia sp.]